jgi:hypothetical protein
MTPDGKKIWNSPAGASLMAAMLGQKPVKPQDQATVKALVKTSKAGQTKPGASSEPTKEE